MVEAIVRLTAVAGLLYATYQVGGLWWSVIAGCIWVLIPWKWFE